MIALFSGDENEFDLSYGFRTFWWGSLNIIYFIFVFWGIFMNKSPEIFITILVATFCIINELFIEICEGNGLNNHNLMLYISIWTQFILMIIFMVELIHFRHHIISYESSYIYNKERTESIGASTNMIKNRKGRKKPSYTSMRDYHQPSNDFDHTMDNTLSEM